MTCIAFDGKNIAVDSRSTQGGTITSDSEQKWFYFPNGDLVFYAGAWCDEAIQFLATCYLEKQPEERKPFSFCGFIVNDSGVAQYGYDDEEGFFWISSRVASKAAAGSGASHALTAMDMGKNAAQAVAIAAKRDTHTGG